MNDIEALRRFKAIQEKHKALKIVLEKLKQFHEKVKELEKDKQTIPKLDIDGKAICDICGKTLKNERGVKIHKGKVHKTNKQTNKLSFDKDGKYKPDKISKIINDYPKPKIKKPKPLFKNKLGKVEKREFYCYKHKTFHKHKFRDNPSKTYQKCIDSDNFHKFKENMDYDELFRVNFKRNWKRKKSDKV